MPRRKAFDKKNSTTFSLVYRAQNDPRIHDPEASDMVFTEKLNPNQNKIKQREELDEEFAGNVRNNEGEAANYGVYFDDSQYDYMQHLRDIGTSGDAYFVEAKTSQKGKGKQKASLADALKEMDLESGASQSQASSRVSVAESLLPGDMLPSEFVQKRSYQDQQNVPDAIAGFQPDMDPRLREVLEALQDDAYVDDDEDIFEELQGDGFEIDQREFAHSGHDSILEEDEGWESDHTIRANDDTTIPDLIPADAAAEDGDWMAEFTKFKKDAKSKPKVKPGTIPADLQSSVQTGASSIAGLRRKKRKGALTATSGYSMTSSVLRRTEELSILDQKFDRIKEEYGEDEMDDNASMFSGMTGMTGMSGLTDLSKISTASKGVTTVRSDFDSIMDDFIGTHSQVGRRRVRRGKPQGGLDELDEIRRELGPARLPKSKAATPVS